MEIRGKAVSKGIVFATAYIYKTDCYEAEEERFAGDADRYIAAFEQACEQADAELEEMMSQMSGAEENAKIFIAHQEMLADEELISLIHEEIRSNRFVPEYAVKKVYDYFIQLLEGAGNDLNSERCMDLADVRNRLIRILKRAPKTDLSALPQDVIVIAHDLLPSDTASLDRKHVKGIITEIGGETSHTAIIAKGYGIPAILGVGSVMDTLQFGEHVAMDAIDGVAYTAPSKEQLALLNEKRLVFEAETASAKQYLEKEAYTADGVKIDIGLNIGADSIESGGCLYDYIGLFRTEFLYMQSNHMPTEDEQFEVYRKVLEQADGKPVTLRTLDIGGDKTLPYFDLPKEENPFLGKRALRLCFDEAELFLTQLRAVLRASQFGTLQIMFPMIGSIDDIRRAKDFIATAKKQLDNAGVGYDKGIKIGIMIEIPSIAMVADMAADEVDFASIGSNDLCQYVCAVDRMNPEVERYYQSLSPAMLRVMTDVVSSFNRVGKSISICGELGGNEDAVVVLVGLGLRKLSMSASSTAGVKQTLSEISVSMAEDMVKQLSRLRTEEEIKKYLSESH